MALVPLHPYISSSVPGSGSVNVASSTSAHTVQENIRATARTCVCVEVIWHMHAVTQQAAAEILEQRAADRVCGHAHAHALALLLAAFLGVDQRRQVFASRHDDRELCGCVRLRE